MSTTTSRRRTPLAAGTAERVVPATPSPVTPVAPNHEVEPEGGPTPTSNPHDRLVAEVRTLRIGRTAVRLEQRILMVLGGAIAPLGLVVVVLGWWGAARTPHVFEQVPYLISGGVLGLSLVVLGGFCYFAHWLTQLIKEQRAQSQAILEALEHLATRVGATVTVPAAGPVTTNGTSDTGPRPLVATQRGSMAHHPSCPAVAGKPGLRRVSPDDGLSPCRLCEPYDTTRA